MIILTEKEYFYANSKGDAEDKLCGTVIRYQYDKMGYNSAPSQFIKLMHI